MKKLAIITTHPIQYNAPLFAMLHKRGIIKIKIFYTWGETVLQKKYDPGFDKNIEWDVPLLEGYDYEFLENISREKGSHHYRGIINPDIINEIEEWNPDAVLVYGWKFQSHLKAIKHFKNKVPVFFRGDSTLLDEKRNFSGALKRILIKWVYRHIDKAFYCGTRNKDYFLYYGLKPRQLVPALHAVDNSRFNNTAGGYDEDAKTILKTMGVQSGNIVFMYAGKLNANKNTEMLLRAFRKLPEENVDLIIVGNGPEENFLKTNFANYRNIHFMDFQNQLNMPVIYQLCDVFVLPSAGETWGLAVNEAMAAGRAILISDKCGGATDLVTDSENGFVFKTGDENDLVEKMKKCISGDPSLSLMKTKSLEKIQRFTFDGIAYGIERTLIAHA